MSMDPEEIDGAESLSEPSESAVPVFHQLSETHPGPYRELVDWLGAALVKDQLARLGEGGFSEDQRVPLAKVFVDLVADGDGSDSADPEPGDPGAPLPKGIVARMLRERPAAPPCREASSAESPAAPPRREAGGGESPAARFHRLHTPHCVLMGGPGRGKSTVVQYLAQLHRVAFLRDRRGALPNERRNVLDLLDALTGKQGLEGPVQPCLPLFVPLARFAAWLAAERPEDRGIERFLTFHVADTLGVSLTEATLDLALNRLPWLLLLDGLDEVPGAADRRRALDMLDRFLEARAGGRCIVIATTRPQGYAGELGGLATRTLCPISRARALTYARQLLAGRYASNPERQRQIEQRIVHASNEPATARLMQTPLQVTIMTSLLTESARAPVERWRLFRDFYNMIVRRESDRNDLVARVLAKLRTHLDVVHERVGLLLQVECERAGGSDASIEEARFIDIVEHRLTEVGYSRADASNQAAELARIARDRLVFLTGVRAGRVGFELRSFQEFFAAEALFNGRDSSVVERARHIARSVAWTNVLLFMASRSMATASSLQAELTVDLCAWLDDPAEDAVAAVLRSGARFALELLDEGALAAIPSLLRDTTARALQLLDLPPSKLLQRLARTFARLCLDPETKEHVEPLVLEGLSPGLKQDRPSNRQGAWVVAVMLADHGVEAAAALVNEAWPADVEEERAILAALNRSELSSSRTIGARLQDLLPRHACNYWETHALQATWCAAWARERSGRTLHAKLFGNEQLYLWFRPLETSEPVAIQQAYQALPYWQLAEAVMQFHASPTPVSLANTLLRFAEHGSRDLCHRFIEDGFLSWVLDACVGWAGEPERFRTLAERAKTGDLGDAEVWRAAQARWVAQGISEHDLEDFIAHEGLPHRSLGERGAARGNLLIWPKAGNLTGMLKVLAALHRRAIGAVAQTFLADLVLRIAANVYADNQFLEEPLSLEDLASLGQDEDKSLSLNSVLALVQAGGTPLVELALRWLAARRRYSMLSQSLRAQPVADVLLHMLRASPDTRSLLRVLAFLPVAEEPIAPVPEDITTPRSGDGGDIEASCLILEVHRGGFSVERAAAIGARLIQLSTPSFVAGWILLRALMHRQPPLDDPDLTLVLAVAAGTASASRFTHVRTEAFSLLGDHQATLTTSLSSPETWEALRLPLPAPLPLPSSADSASAGASAPMDVPIHFREIEIHGLRCYAAAQFTDLHHESDRGQWLVLLGENGTGKTTLLRSIAMALLGREVGNLALGSSEAPYRRTGVQRATIDVRTPTLPVYQALIDGENGLERFVVPAPPETERPFVVAYGCRRGSALGGPERTLDFSRLAAIRTLFDDPTAGLVPAEHWLRDLYRDVELESPPSGAQQLLNDVLKVVTTLLPDVGRPTIDKHGVWVKGPATGDVQVRLSAMSDGYLTSLGWVIDMMARWLKPRQDAGKKIPERFYKAMTGVVLLDELDLHLHPRWQVRVVRDLKKLFRRMTFVVTTHNPMTLVGAHKREIWVLGRDGGGAATVHRHDTDPRLSTGSELYARFFGLSELYPDDLGRDLRRYGFLASNPFRADDEEREVHELLERLKREGVDPGFPPAPREGL